ncbi:hypothetical protein [Hoeflea sp.]|uniref:hypothetical protein n=1 Tax=Hoeflea sp. TaxID=1940281 RepID=UPI003747EC0E
MTRKKSTIAAAIALLLSGPFYIDIFFAFFRNPQKSVLYEIFPAKYISFFMVFCWFILITFVFSLLFHYLYKYLRFIYIIDEDDMRVIISHPISGFFIWSETIDIFEERRRR